MRERHMSRRKAKERLEREGLNHFQQCDNDDAQRNYCVRECVGEIYDKRFHEWIRR